MAIHDKRADRVRIDPPAKLERKHNAGAGVWPFGLLHTHAFLHAHRAMTPHPPPAPMLPSLPVAEWQDTYTTLHLWTQIVGKIRLALMPAINHWWQATLYVTPSGLTTGSIPCNTRTFEIRFDFLEHQLRLEAGDGASRSIKLAPRSVADFYRAVMAALKELEIDISIWTMPQEMVDPIRFEYDELHASYDSAYVQRFRQILVQADRILTIFRSRFIGKSSPVHFFWGSFDLAVTRFSGRSAPPHPGGVSGMADWVTREAYSHEVSSCGFWPGGGSFEEPVFYAYAYPAPEGYNAYPVEPEEAFYSSELQEFILPYEVLRQAVDPDAVLLAFLQSTYEAAATLGHWDRMALERKPAA